MLPRFLPSHSNLTNQQKKTPCRQGVVAATPTDASATMPNGRPSTSVVCDTQQRAVWLAYPFIDAVPP